MRTSRDSAAPVAVAAAAGLHVSRLDGSPLRYNAANPYLPDLLICRPDLAEAVLTRRQLTFAPRRRRGAAGGIPIIVVAHAAVARASDRGGASCGAPH